MEQLAIAMCPQGSAPAGPIQPTGPNHSSLQLLDPVHRPVSALTVAIALATTAHAQNDVWFPSDHDYELGATPIDGSSSTNRYPLSNGASRTMYVFSSRDLLIPAGAIIDRIGFKADQTRLSTGQQLQLSIDMGYSDLDPSTSSGTFATNYRTGTTPVTVYPLAIQALPSLNDPSAPNPDGEMVFFDLANPFTYDGTSNLVLDFKVAFNSNGGQPFNYYLDTTSFLSPSTNVGIGCVRSGGTNPFTVTSSSAKVGGNFSATCSNATSGFPIILHANVGRPFLPNPLNIPLPGGAAAPCKIHIDPTVFDLVLVTSASSTGSAFWSFPVPNNPMLNDGIVRMQALTYDVFTQPQALLSNGHERQLGIDPQCAIIRGTAGNANATTGSRLSNWGQQVYFRWQ